MLVLLPSVSSLKLKITQTKTNSFVLNNQYKSTFGLTKSPTPYILTLFVWFFKVVLPDALFMIYYIIARILGIEERPQPI